MEVVDLQFQSQVVEEEEAFHQPLSLEEEVVGEVSHKLRDHYTYFAPFNHIAAFDLEVFFILQHFSEGHQAHAACPLATKPFHLYRVQPNLIRRPCSRTQDQHRDAW